MNDPDPRPVSADSTTPSGGDPATTARLTMIVYALQAAAFVIGVTALIAIVINYLKLNDVRGTWLESHFRWQMRTFWFSLLWAVIGIVTLVVLIGWAILMANMVWVIYRIVKGWMCLAEGKPMYVDT